MMDNKGTPRWVASTLVALAILVLAGAGFGAGFGWHIYSVIGDLSRSQQSAAAHTGQQITTLEQNLSAAMAANTNLQSDVDVVTKRLRVTQTDLQRARKEAAQIRETSDRKISDLGINVKTELATKASADELKTVNGTVTVVKDDLETTKSELKLARSELGTLIARNHEDINALRRMGERDYVEFAIAARKKSQKVGGIILELRSVDVKSNKFTVAMIVNDVRTEKKDRLTNEPIFFYPPGARQPSELVINTVAKDKIAGYISSPKPSALSASASTN